MDYRAGAIEKLKQLPPDGVLARLLYGEIRNGDDRAMAACALTVIHRVAKPRWWGTTITEVCLKDKQYSCFNADDPNLKLLMEPVPHVLAKCLWVASGVSRGYVKDFTGGATHYLTHAVYKGTDWAQKLPKTYEDAYHIFFVEK